VDDDRLLGRGDDDDVVVAGAAVGKEHDDRLAVVHARGEGVERTAGAGGAPAARRDRAGQHVVGDAAGAPIDQRRERLRVGVRVAVVPEHHRRRRAAAQGVGLRQVRHVDRQSGGERQRGGQRGEHGQVGRPEACAT